MNQKRVVNKRKSSVVSTQTYRKMIEKVLEEAPTKALDLHGIYDALASEYDQYREDSVEVDWRVLINFLYSSFFIFIFIFLFPYLFRTPSDTVYR